MDISNDPEVERLGANATAVHAMEFWHKLCKAARQDGRLLDPVWENASGTNGSTNGSNEIVASATTKLVLTETTESDRRLYKRFRSNFSFLDVKQVTPSTLSGERWQSLLLASEGTIDSYNFMALMRLDAMDIFWMTESEVCDGMTVVPRAQFLFIELSRLAEGVYASPEFRRKLQLWDVKCRSEELLEALGKKDEAAALQTLELLRTQWPYPRTSILKESGVLRAVQKGWKSGSTESIRTGCQDLLQYWQDLVAMGKLALASPKQFAALERAGRALANQGGPQGSSQRTSLITRTTSSLTDLIPPTMTAAPHIFSQYGMLVVKDFLEQTQVQECKTTAAACLQALVDEQLAPRGLAVDGINTFDYTEVRQRPGHRVDNRYKIMDSDVVKTISGRLLEELPRLLNGDKKDAKYKLLYGGVVHSFPREKESDPIPDAQIWHRDGPSLFDSAHHETHCFNVFIPLIDVSTANGTTEFIPGSHNDTVFEKNMMELLNQPDDNELAVQAEVGAGSMIIFDVRVLHRGLANASMEERPMLYFTLAQTWFQEEHMFDYSKSLVKKNGVHTNGVNTNGGNGSSDTVSFRLGRLYELVSGEKAPIESSYGHPHYTTRFDLMLAEMEDDARKTQNMDAILNFCTSGQQDNLANALIDILRSPGSKAKKQQVLKQAGVQRKEQRAAEARAYIHYTELVVEEDFASIATDMSDVTTLYKLTAKLAFKESWSLSKLGFTEDMDGVCILLATLKAYSLRETAKVKTARLEEAFTDWWHAGVDRFHFVRVNRKQAPRVLVVFSSLGSGIARPEWGGSIAKLAPSEKLDILYVLDPSFSWYCQDPTCQWKGGDYYYKELKKRLKKYEAVLFLGDSMGAAAALRFSSLANAVLAFSPQVDISYYEAITREDFTTDIRLGFELELLQACRETSARMLIHYGEHCDEDVRAVNLLPSRRNIKLVAHDFDDHILSLHLREEGKLQGIIDDAFGAFMTATFSSLPPPPSFSPLSRASKWLPNGSMLGLGRLGEGTVQYEHNLEHSIPLFETQLDVLMMNDGSIMFLQSGEEEIDFTM
jgi:hypothetical protein